MSRKNRSPEKKPVEQRSVNCCRWRTSTAWTTSRTCSREPLPNLWRMVWRPNWMRILVTANTTIRTKLRTTAGTATAAKICEPVLAMSRFLFPVTGKDVLGMWVGENESAKFWATVLNGLRNRGPVPWENRGVEFKAKKGTTHDFQTRTAGHGKA